MIVVWGLTEDPPTAAVCTELATREVDVIFVDQARIDEFRLGGGDATLQSSEFEVPLSDISAMYLRPYDVRQIPGMSLEGGVADRVDRVQNALIDVANSATPLSVNRPDSRDLNQSKPAQLRLVEKHAPSLHRPETLVTTSRSAFEDFVERHQRAVVKSVSGHRSRVRSITLAELSEDQLGAVTFCPVQVQEFVAGVDFRVHVVGRQTFATMIGSSAVDYRYEAATLHEASVPDWIEDSCVALARAMDLIVAGVDIRRTDDGRWYCFEVNPSPAFTYYEHRTGQPISAAIADLLMRAAADRPCDTTDPQ